MKHPEIIKQILETIRLEESAAAGHASQRRSSCDTYSGDIYELYAESSLSEEDAAAFEAHLKECLACCQGLEGALETARRKNKMPPEALLQTGASLNRSLRNKLQHLNALFDRREQALIDMYQGKGKKGPSGRTVTSRFGSLKKDERAAYAGGKNR